VNETIEPKLDEKILESMNILEYRRSTLPLGGWVGD